MATQVNRDPFARMSLMREKYEGNQSCAWCGQKAKFTYHWKDDSNRPNYSSSRPFCSVSCYRTYYDDGNVR
jgi:hypothetical protein